MFAPKVVKPQTKAAENPRHTLALQRSTRHWLGHEPVEEALFLQRAIGGQITSTNYTSAASDLTPNMSDLKGRPPRNSLWASDLTIIHEQFHVSERKTHGGRGVTNAQAWLNTQTASSAADVQNLLTQVPGKVIATSQAAMTMPGKEERAYIAGAPLYSARAVAIKAKGDAGGYPTPPAPPSP
jgi:hypothetical protein